MLDPQGFVATCNSVNFFCVRRGEVRTIDLAHTLDLVTNFERCFLKPGVGAHHQVSAARNHASKYPASVSGEQHTLQRA